MLRMTDRSLRSRSDGGFIDGTGIGIGRIRREMVGINTMSRDTSSC